MEKTNTNVTFDNCGFTLVTGVHIAYSRQDYGSVLYTDNSEDPVDFFVYNSRGLLNLHVVQASSARYGLHTGNMKFYRQNEE